MGRIIRAKLEEVLVSGRSHLRFCHFTEIGVDGHRKIEEESKCCHKILTFDRLVRSASRDRYRNFQGPSPVPSLPTTENRVSAARVREDLLLLMGPGNAIPRSRR